MPYDFDALFKTTTELAAPVVRGLRSANRLPGLMPDYYGAPPGTGRIQPLPVAPQNPIQPEEPIEPLIVPPDEPSWLETIGDVLDRPGNALRGVLAGRPQSIKGLIPFAETIGAYDRKTEHTSGQDVNEALFGIDKTDDLLSGAGIAGLATELLADPLNALPGFMGIKGLTKAGHSAAKVGGHLKDARRVGNAALRAAKETAKAVALKAELHPDDVAAAVAKAAKGVTAAHPEYGYELMKGGEMLADADIVAQLAQRGDKVGDAARATLANNLKRGVNSFDEIADAGERVRAGQEAFLQVGGEYNPLALLQMGGRFNPVNWLPPIPILLPVHTWQFSNQICFLTLSCWGEGRRAALSLAG